MIYFWYKKLLGKLSNRPFSKLIQVWYDNIKYPRLEIWIFNHSFVFAWFK